MILGLIEEAVEAGARREKAVEVLGLSLRTLQRWRTQEIGEDRRAGPRTAPANKLTSQERQQFLQVACSSEHRDSSPKQIVPKLADQGLYLGSESTLYRLLREEDMLHHREPSKAPHRRSRPTPYVATAPNQVWSWDITYLPSHVRGLFHYLYLVLDVWSRKIVAFQVFSEESSELAAELISMACHREGIAREQLVIHSDNGSPMRGATLTATLQALGVAQSYSRPRVSNDNPFIESSIRTLKSRPAYPRSGFATIEEAMRWVTGFVIWYNTEHQHSSIRFVTPEQRHAGLDAQILANRKRVYANARAANPERWTGPTRNWTPIEEVHLNPAPEKPAKEVA